MLRLTDHINIAEWELSFQAIRAQGPGGQHVNKASTAVQLRFDIQRSRLPQHIKQRLLSQSDQRINKDGTIVIKAQSFRTQEQNKDDALERLRGIIQSAMHTPKRRLATKPSKSAKRKRTDQKTQRGKVKALRGKVII